MSGGDETTQRFLFDSKQTDKKGFRITIEMWEKLFDEALREKRLPALILELGRYDLVILEMADFKYLEEGCSRYEGLQN